MKKAINRSFDLCSRNKCLSTERAKFFKIYDREDLCCFICTDNTEHAGCCIQVENKDRKAISLLAIDKCLLDVSETRRRCDCAVFDDSLFCFVEIKDQNDRTKARKEAYEQLESTIEMFQEKVTFSEITVEAVVCLGETKSVPRVQAQNIGMAVKFFDRFGVDLKEGNRISF